MAQVLYTNLNQWPGLTFLSDYQVSNERATDPFMPTLQHKYQGWSSMID